MRVDYFLTTSLKEIAATPFRFKGFSPTPLAFAPYDYCYRYSGCSLILKSVTRHESSR